MVTDTLVCRKSPYDQHTVQWELQVECVHSDAVFCINSIESGRSSRLNECTVMLYSD